MSPFCLASMNANVGQVSASIPLIHAGVKFALYHLTYLKQLFNSYPCSVSVGLHVSKLAAETTTMAEELGDIALIGLAVMGQVPKPAQQCLLALLLNAVVLNVNELHSIALRNMCLN